MTTDEDNGWAWPVNSRKAHYFVNCRALCGKWMYFGRAQRCKTQESGETPGPDDCVLCHRKLRKGARSHG